MNRHLFKTSGIILLALLAVFALYWGARRMDRRGDSPSVATADAGAQRVTVFDVRRSTFTDAIEGLIGTIKGDTIQLNFQQVIEEPVSAVHVRVGQRVKRGDVLMESNRERAEALKNKAEASYERASQMHKAGAATALDLKEARSMLDIARRDLESTYLRAPKNGYVSEINRKVGEMVGRDIPGPVAVLVSSEDRLYLETGVVEGQVMRVQPGQRVDVLVEALGPPPMEGRVTGVSREVTTTGRTGAVQVDLPAAAQSRLRPGLSATCRILTFDGPALMIPRQSYDTERGGVFEVVDGRAVFRTVALGYLAPDDYEAARGLNGGERIVRDLILNPVEDGAPVRVEDLSPLGGE